MNWDGSRTDWISLTQNTVAGTRQLSSHGGIMSYTPNTLVRKRTVNDDKTITLSAPSWLIVGQVDNHKGEQLIYGVQVNWNDSGHVQSTPVTGLIELLPDGYQA